MLKTPNLKLNKPEGSDIVNIADLNENMDILDTNFTQTSKTIKDHGNDEKNPHNVTTEQVNYIKPNTFTEDEPITSYKMGLSVMRADLGSNSWVGYTNYWAIIRTTRSAASSHGSQEITIYNNARITGVYYRVSTGTASNPTWREWQQVLTEDDVILSDAIDSDSSSQVATSNAVKKAYDRAVEVDSMQVNRISRAGITPDSLPEDFPEGYSIIGDATAADAPLWIDSIGAPRYSGYRILIEIVIGTSQNNAYPVHRQRVTYFTDGERGLVGIYERFAVNRSLGDGERTSWGPWARMVTEDMIIDSTPTGIISMWSGAINTIPSGWALCDGTSGTPNLVDRFIVGAGSDYNVGDTGGEESVTLTTAQMPSHSHSKGTLTTNTTGAHTHKSGGRGTGSTTKFSIGGMGTEMGFVSDVGTTSSDGSHNHTISGSTATSGSGQAHENRPPYYALAYIMKL